MFALLLCFSILAGAQTVPGNLYNGLKWRLIGPFRGGRTVAVAGFPGNATTFYFGSVGGGLWQTSDAGVVWKPIFDGQAVASVGAVAVAPSDAKVIYVGTGESDIRSNLSSGDGVYKSTDGGQSWSNIGLKETRQISRVVVDPQNADVVYVGALGHAYAANKDRGVKTAQYIWEEQKPLLTQTRTISKYADPMQKKLAFALMDRTLDPKVYEQL